MNESLTCACGKRRRLSDESPDSHGPECCTCPRGTRAHLAGCPASYTPAPALLVEDAGHVVLILTPEQRSEVVKAVARLVAWREDVELPASDLKLLLGVIANADVDTNPMLVATTAGR